MSKQYKERQFERRWSKYEHRLISASEPVIAAFKEVAHDFWMNAMGEDHVVIDADIEFIDQNNLMLTDGNQEVTCAG